MLLLQRICSLGLLVGLLALSSCGESRASFGQSAPEGYSDNSSTSQDYQPSEDIQSAIAQKEMELESAQNQVEVACNPSVPASSDPEDGPTKIYQQSGCDTAKIYLHRVGFELDQLRSQAAQGQ